MVSFFGLGRKKKNSQDGTSKNAGSKTTTAVAAAAAVHVAAAPAPWMKRPTASPTPDNGFRDIPQPPALSQRRPGTSASMRSHSPFAFQATFNSGNSTPGTMERDSANRPRADSHALPRPDAFGMRLGNGSAASLLQRPPALDALPARPGTSHGDDRPRRPWGGPSDMQLGRNATAPAAPPRSPRTLMADSGTEGLARGDDAAAAPIITQVNSTSPPLLSPLEGAAGLPPTGALPSPPRSINGSGDRLKPRPGPIGPTALPSPALSSEDGPGTNSRSGSGSGSDHQVDGLGISGNIPKPIGFVIQNVAAKRDTLTISVSRQQSLSMTIEAFEQSLLSAQQESEQRAKAATTSSGPTASLRPDERGPLSSFVTNNNNNNNNNIDSRSQSPIPMRGPPPTGPLPSPNMRGAEQQRPNLPFANRRPGQSPMGRGPRSESPMRLPPPQNRGPRAASPMGRGPPMQRVPPSPFGEQQQRRPSNQQQKRPPGQQQRRPSEQKGPAGNGGSGSRRPPPANVPSDPAVGSQGADSGTCGDQSLNRGRSASQSVQYSPQFDLEIQRSPPSLPKPRLDFSDGPGPAMSTAPLSPMIRSPGAATVPSSPVVRGPGGLPRRPTAEEYGMALPRSNSDRDLLRGPPKAAVGAHRGNNPTPPLASPLRSPARIEQQRPWGGELAPPPPRILSPQPPQPQTPTQLSPAPVSPRLKHQQQHSLELSWSFSKDGGDASKPANKFAAPLPSPLFPNRDFGGPPLGGGNSLQVPASGASPGPSPKFPFNDGKDHEDEDGLSGPPTPDSTNWPLPSSSSPGMGSLQPPPPPPVARSRSASAAVGSDWAGSHEGLSVGKTTNSAAQWRAQHGTGGDSTGSSVGGRSFGESPSRRAARAKVPPPLNLFSAQQYADAIGKMGPYTPSPTRSMTTPIAACDVPPDDRKPGGSHPEGIGMARGLSLVHEQEQFWKEHQKAHQQQQQQQQKQQSDGVVGGMARRPDHGLEAPTGIADRFGTGFI